MNWRQLSLGLLFALAIVSGVAAFISGMVNIIKANNANSWVDTKCKVTSISSIDNNPRTWECNCTGFKCHTCIQDNYEYSMEVNVLTTDNTLFKTKFGYGPYHTYDEASAKHNRTHVGDIFTCSYLNMGIDYSSEVKDYPYRAQIKHQILRITLIGVVIPVVIGIVAVIAYCYIKKKTPYMGLY